MDVERPCGSASVFERIASTGCRPEEDSVDRSHAVRIAASLELHMRDPIPAETASAFIDDRIRELADWRGRTLARVRGIIHEADPGIVEEWKWMGTPVWSHDGIV